MIHRFRSLIMPLIILALLVGCAGATPSPEQAQLEEELRNAQNAVETAQAQGVDLANAQATASAASAALATMEARSGAEPVLIGVSLPVSGGVAISGMNQLNGFNLAVQEINSSGGVLGGRPLKAIVEDDRCDSAQAVTAYERLHSAGVSVTFGSGCSGATLAAMPLMEEAEIPNVTGVSTNPKIAELSGVGGNIWSFRINPPDDAFGKVAGDVYVKTLGYKTFSGLALDDDWGRGALAEFKASIEAAGGEFLTEDYYAPLETDFLSVLTKIKAANPDTILAFMNPDPLLAAGKQYIELGMDMPFSGRPQIFDSKVIEGLTCEVLAGFTTIDPWFRSDPSPRAQEFAERIQAAYGVSPVWQHLTSYTGAYVIADAIDRAGSDDPAAIRDALEAMDYDSIYGRLQFDDHNQAHGNVFVAQMQPDCTVEVIYSSEW